MAAKVKLTDLNTGQEYFLLVTKINLQGLRVESSRTLQPGTPLQLSLQLEEGQKALELRGEIHTVAQRPDGGKGMVIRFTDPDPIHLDILQAYLNSAQISAPKKTPAPRDVPSMEKTMIAYTEKPVPPVRARPKAERPKVSSTMDEEAVQGGFSGLDGKTRISAPAEIEAFVRKKKRSTGPRKYLFGFILLFGLGAAYFYREKLVSFLRLLSPPPPIAHTKPTVTPSTTIAAVQLTPISPQKEERPSARTEEPATTEEEVKPAPAVKRGKITAITTEDGDAFVKVTITGNANFSRHEVSRVMNPKRLVIHLPEISSFSVEKIIGVTLNPLLRIRTEKANKGVQLTLELYPVAFPRYEVKDRGESLEIFLHR